MTNGVMSDFQAAVAVMPPLHEFVDAHLKVIKDLMPELSDAEAREQAVKAYQETKAAKVWVNDQYQVAIDMNPRHGFPGTKLWHLSIKRFDREPIHDWRDLQEIKNRLCGENVEAIELYPMQDRVVDMANQYHLFAFMSQKNDSATTKEPMLPVGFGRGLIMSMQEDQHPADKSKQRPLAPVVPERGEV